MVALDTLPFGRESGFAHENRLGHRSEYRKSEELVTVDAIMTNRKVDEIIIPGDGLQRRISFWQGNPANIGPDDQVDLIIVSAFRNNYTPTRWSIIGALDRRGISVAELALDKEVDLWETAGFW